MFRQDFTADFNAIVEAQGPFGFIRFNDGEHAILQGLAYRSASGWGVSEVSPWLQGELRDALVNPPEGVYIGISSPCCIAQAAAYYRTVVRVPPHHVTFASLFSHRNFRRVGALFARYPDPVIVAPRNADFLVPPDGVAHEWDIDRLVKNLLDVDRPIFVAAGPCANLIITRYWKAQSPEKRQAILDVGAAIDRRIHGQVTRAYNLKPKHACSWDKWHPFAPATSKNQKQREAQQRMQAAFARGHVSKKRERIDLGRSDRKPRKAKHRVRTK